MIRWAGQTRNLVSGDPSPRTHLAPSGIPNGRALDSGSRSIEARSKTQDDVNAPILTRMKPDGRAPRSGSSSETHNDVNAPIITQIKRLAVALDAKERKVRSSDSLRTWLARAGLPDGRPLSVAPKLETHDDINAWIHAQIKRNSSTFGPKEFKVRCFQPSLRFQLVRFGVPGGKHLRSGWDRMWNEDADALSLAMMVRQATGTNLEDGSISSVSQLPEGYSNHPIAHSQGRCVPCCFAYRHQQDSTRYPHECLKKDCERCHKAHSADYMRKYKGDVQRLRRQKAKPQNNLAVFEAGFIF